MTATAVRRLRTRLLRRPGGLAFAGYGALGVWLFFSAWRDPATRWIGGAGDPPKFMWSLRWNPYAVAHGLNPFFTHHINSTDGVNLLWDTSVPLPSWVVAPVTLVAGPVVSYNLLATAAPVLSAWCAYVCFRRYVRSHWAAATGGLLYGFSPYVMAKTIGGHLNLSLVFTAPLLVVLLDEILVRQRRRPAVPGVALGVLAAAQLLVGQEVLATEALAASVGTLALALLYRSEVRARAPYAARALGTALAVFAALAALPVVQALGSSRRPTHGTLYSHDIFVSDLLGFVVPSRVQQLRFPGSAEVTSRFTDSCCIADTHTYLGVPLIAVMIVAAARSWRRPIVRVAVVVAVVMAVLSLGPHLHVNGRVLDVRLPAHWLTKVPLLSQMLVSRLLLYVYLFGGLLVAVFLDGIWRPDELGRRSRRASVAAVASIAGVAAAYAFLFPRVPFPKTRSNVPGFFSSSEVVRIPEGSVALVAPFARDTDTSEPMLWQAVAGMRFKTPSGYATGRIASGRFGYLPDPTPLSTVMREVQYGKDPPLNDALLGRLREELAAERVETVIVGPFPQRDRMVALFRRLLGRAPEHVRGVDVWWDVDAIVTPPSA